MKNKTSERFQNSIKTCKNTPSTDWEDWSLKACSKANYLDHIHSWSLHICVAIIDYVNWPIPEAILYPHDLLLVYLFSLTVNNNQEMSKSIKLVQLDQQLFIEVSVPHQERECFWLAKSRLTRWDMSLYSSFFLICKFSIWCWMLHIKVLLCSGQHHHMMIPFF
jgi:hypothetical protein